MEMKADRVTEVKSVADERFLLENTLRPVWKFLFYNGVLRDFSRGEDESRAFYIARFTLTTIIAMLFLIYSVFLVFQLIVSFQIDSTIFDKVDIIYLFVLTLLALFFQCYYLIYQNELRLILKEWDEIEIGETGARWSINVYFENIYYLSVTNLNKLPVI